MSERISVKDKLPKERLLVLIFEPREGRNYHMKIDSMRDGEWEERSRKEIYARRDVTHWMRLPEPPQSDAEK